MEDSIGSSSSTRLGGRAVVSGKVNALESMVAIAGPSLHDSSAFPQPQMSEYVYSSPQALQRTTRSFVDSITTNAAKEATSIFAMRRKDLGRIGSRTSTHPPFACPSLDHINHRDSISWSNELYLL